MVRITVNIRMAPHGHVVCVSDWSMISEIVQFVAKKAALPRSAYGAENAFEQNWNAAAQFMRSN